MLKIRKSPQETLIDIEFIENRTRLIDLAAFLDSIDAMGGHDDFRVRALRKALPLLLDGKGERARRILMALSDPREELSSKAAGKSAFGAFKDE